MSGNNPPPPTPGPSGTGRRRLTTELVKTARRRVKQGEQLALVADDLGLSYSAVWNAVYGRTFARVQSPPPLPPLKDSDPRRLSSEFVAQARCRVSAGETVSALADETGVDESGLRCAVTGRSWKRLTDPPPVRNLQNPERRRANSGNAKLTTETVTAARKAARRGETIADLARRYGVSVSVMSFAVRGTTWKDVAEPPVPREPRNILTAKTVASARRRAAQGEKTRALAREFGVPRYALERAIVGTTWAHLLTPPPVPHPTRSSKQPRVEQQARVEQQG